MGNNDKDSGDAYGAISDWSPWKEWSSTFEDALDFSSRAVSRLLSATRTDFDLDRPSVDGSRFGLGLERLPLSGLFGPEPEQNWAMPVPTPEQYAFCKEQGGDSGWTKAGVWRCLLGDNAAAIKGLGELFPDYNAYLDFKVQMMETRRRQAPELAEKQSVFSNRSSWLGDKQSHHPQFITEKDVKGKEIGHSISTETVSLPNGSIENKRRIIRYYDDNTATQTEQVDTGDSTESGWFWK